MAESPKSVLAILSHVVHGYVGNRATVFPLQYNGWDVDAVNTTNYSNHPGYGSFEGKATSPELVGELIQGLKDIVDFNSTYDVILTGYAPSAALLDVVYDQLMPVFGPLSSGTKTPVWVVDPAMGDNGRLYVPETVVEAYKRFYASGYVTLTTPNQFEFELLSQTSIDSWDSVVAALRKFHGLYKVPYVVISSVAIDGQMYGVGYDAGLDSVFGIAIDELACNFNGCGDLFTALAIDGFHRRHKLDAHVLGNALSILHNILEASYNEEAAELGVAPTYVKDIRVVALRRFLLDEKEIADVIYKS